MSSSNQKTSTNFSPMQQHFLTRLRRLLRLRKEQSNKLNQGGLQLIDRAIYTTYCDAADCGVTVAAQQMLQRYAVPTKER
ncbi:MAG: hypothetical protein IH957_11835 [Chloroflexi bacterium]|nr:hypothetical protein [Chloroflexota bacterium]